MTDSLKEQAKQALEARREAKKQAAEQKVNQSSNAVDAIMQSQARQNKKKADTPQFDIDRLQLYLGEPFKLNEKITVLQPTVGDLIRFGEKEAYSVVHVFTANTTSYRMILWDMDPRVDWCKITDFELFQMLCPTLNQAQTSFLFGDIDFSKLQRYQKQIGEDVSIVLYDPEQDLEIDENMYKKLAWYVRSMFNIYPKIEFGKGRATKEALIDEDRLNYERHKNDPYSSTLLPLISTCLNHPGFKYTKSELVNVGIVEFMDSVQRLQIYESTRALYTGMYSGFVDTSKIPKEQFDFMRNASLT